MFEQVQREQRQDIAVTSSAAAADLVAATLNAHGIAASTVAYAHPYPSVDWVEGYRVSVAAADEAAARELLDDLSRDDVAGLPEDSDHDE